MINKERTDQNEKEEKKMMIIYETAASSLSPFKYKLSFIATIKCSPWKTTIKMFAFRFTLEWLILRNLIEKNVRSISIFNNMFDENRFIISTFGKKKKGSDKRLIDV